MHSVSHVATSVGQRRNCQVRNFRASVVFGPGPVSPARRLRVTSSALSVRMSSRSISSRPISAGRSPSLEMQYCPNGRCDSFAASVSQSGLLRKGSDWRRLSIPSARALSSQGGIPHGRIRRCGIETWCCWLSMISSQDRASSSASSQSTVKFRPRLGASIRILARPAAGFCSTQSDTAACSRNGVPIATLAFRGGGAASFRRYTETFSCPAGIASAAGSGLRYVRPASSVSSGRMRSKFVAPSGP